MVYKTALRVRDSGTEYRRVYLSPGGYVSYEAVKEGAPGTPIGLAVKVQILGAGDLPNVRETTKTRSENAIYDYLNSITIGRDDPLQTQTPFLKVYCHFDVTLTFREFIQLFRGVISDSTILEELEEVKEIPLELVAYPTPDVSVDVLASSAFAAETTVELNIQVSELIRDGTLWEFLQRDTGIVDPIANPAAASSQQVICQALCTLYLMHNVLRATHFDARTVNWLMRKVSVRQIIRYDLAPNVALFFDTAKTDGLVPVLADFGAAVIDTMTDLPPQSPYGSRSQILRVDKRPGVTWVAVNKEGRILQHPNFDVELLAREILEVIPWTTFASWTHAFRSMITDLSVSDRYAELQRDYPDNPRVQRFNRYLQKLDKMRKVQPTEVAKWAAFQNVVRDIKWFMFEPTGNDSMINMLGYYYTTVFVNFAYTEAIESLGARRSDFGLKVGHISGGTLPLIQIQTS